MLPDINFAVKDPATIESDLIANVETQLGRTLAAADPARIFVKTLVYLASLIRSDIDHTGKQNLLAYTAGDNLDHFVAGFDVMRNPAQAASVTLRFTLSAAQAGSITIPAGTRATADNALFFATTAAATIPAGQLYIDVAANCINTDDNNESIGAVANDIPIGDINTIVDPIAYVATVVNTTISSGGIDKESDASVKERYQQALEKFSTAGATAAYVYWAKTYSQNVIDVGVYSPTPGVVNVVPLMTGGTLPTTSELAGIAEILSDEAVRPLTDLVNVIAPTPISYDIAITYYINLADSLNVATIQTLVNQAVTEFQTWQRGKIGRNINPSKLTALIMQAGAKRVTVTAPTDITLANNEVAAVNSVTIIYGGLEDE